MSNLIRVMVIKPGHVPEITEIENTLKGFQKVVGGYIETVPMENIDDDLRVVLNEEGKNIGLPMNRVWKPYGVGGYAADIMVGTIFIVITHLDGFASLTDEQIKKLEEHVDEYLDPNLPKEAYA